MSLGSPFGMLDYDVIITRQVDRRHWTCMISMRFSQFSLFYLLWNLRPYVHCCIMSFFCNFEAIFLQNLEIKPEVRNLYRCFGLSDEILIYAERHTAGITPLGNRYSCKRKELTHYGIVTRQGSRSTLVQVMACSLTAPSHYLNQCWLIITKVQWCSSEGNFA